MLCASQNLLAGAYRDASIVDTASDAYKARKEDTDALFDGALEAAREVFFYASPLLGEWHAPAHPFLSPEREARGAPPSPWVRKGPAAGTRAWVARRRTGPGARPAPRQRAGSAAARRRLRRRRRRPDAGGARVGRRAARLA